MKKFLRRVQWWLTARRRARELQQEMQLHADLLSDELRNAGESPESAAQQARRVMGNMTIAHEDAQSVWVSSAIDRVWQDTRYGARLLLKYPGFSVVAGLTLTLGIGATTATFSVVHAVLLRPLPYPAGQELALIWRDDVPRGLHEEAWSLPEVSDVHARSRRLDDAAFFTPNPVVLTGNGGDQRTNGAFVSENLFSLLRVNPRMGRTFSRDEAERGAGTAVISHRLWMQRYGGAADVLERSVTIDGDITASKAGPRTVRVIGVMPEHFDFPDKETDVWEPARAYWRWSRESADPRFKRLFAIGRLRPDAAPADVQDELQSIGLVARVVPLVDQLTGPTLRSALWILFAAVLAVMLIACINVSSLLLARGASRQRELAVRAALGAGRGRLVRQLLIESILLAIVAGAAGLGVAAAVIRLVAVSAPALPRGEALSINGQAVLFAVGLATMAGVLFGMMPAWKMARSQPQMVLKEAAGLAGGRHTQRVRNLLVLGECALAVVLLAAAGLLVRSLINVQAIQPGFNPYDVLVARMSLPLTRTAPGMTSASIFAERQARIGEVLDRLRTLPGVVSAAAAGQLLIEGSPNDGITFNAQAGAAAAAAVPLAASSVSASFFETMQVPIRRGRSLDPADLQIKIRRFQPNPSADVAPEPVVVNEMFARRFLSGESPLGKRFCSGCPTKPYWYEIVGVAGDMHRQGLERQPVAEYFQLLFGTQTVDLLVRTRTDPFASAATIKAVILSVEPHATVLQMTTAEQQIGDLIEERRFQTSVLAAFAAAAIGLAAIGIYGVIRYAVAERTREFAVRMALGASSTNLLRLVMLEGMRWPAAGLLVGVAAAFGLTRLLAHLLFDVAASDPVTFAIAGVALIVVSLVACLGPAWRATRIDPLGALRQE